jgi:hypothetical protein
VRFSHRKSDATNVYHLSDCRDVKDAHQYIFAGRDLRCRQRRGHPGGQGVRGKSIPFHGGFRSSHDHVDRMTASQLLRLVYDQLRNVAARRLARENSGQMLQATATLQLSRATSCCNRKYTWAWLPDALENNLKFVRHISPGCGTASRSHPGGKR